MNVIYRERERERKKGETWKWETIVSNDLSHSLFIFLSSWTWQFIETFLSNCCTCFLFFLLSLSLVSSIESTVQETKQLNREKEGEKEERKGEGGKNHTFFPSIFLPELCLPSDRKKNFWANFPFPFSSLTQKDREREREKDRERERKWEREETDLAREERLSWWWWWSFLNDEPRGEESSSLLFLSMRKKKEDEEREERERERRGEEVMDAFGRRTGKVRGCWNTWFIALSFQPLFFFCLLFFFLSLSLSSLSLLFFFLSSSPSFHCSIVRLDFFQKWKERVATKERERKREERVERMKEMKWCKKISKSSCFWRKRGSKPDRFFSLLFSSSFSHSLSLSISSSLSLSLFLLYFFIQNGIEFKVLRREVTHQNPLSPSPSLSLSLWLFPRRWVGPLSLSLFFDTSSSHSLSIIFSPFLNFEKNPHGEETWWSSSWKESEWGRKRERGRKRDFMIFCVSERLKERMKGYVEEKRRRRKKKEKKKKKGSLM